MASLSYKALAGLTGVYLAAVNASSAFLFWYDKQQALSHGWRVPEKSLQMTALLGGWIGGMWAMEAFRHKTTKQSFRTPYFAAVGANVVLMGGAGYFVYTRSSAQNQQMINQLIDSPLGRAIKSEAKKAGRRFRL